MSHHESSTSFSEYAFDRVETLSTDPGAFEGDRREISFAVSLPDSADLGGARTGSREFDGETRPDFDGGAGRVAEGVRVGDAGGGGGMRDELGLTAGVRDGVPVFDALLLGAGSELSGVTLPSSACASSDSIPALLRVGLAEGFFFGTREGDGMDTLMPPGESSSSGFVASVGVRLGVGE